VMTPGLAGKSLEEARNILKELGLEVGEITYQVKSDLTPDTVLEQFPPEGAQVKKGAKIYMIVSTLEL
jgi:beta-lactam-binding protein with PASTA domain